MPSDQSGETIKSGLQTVAVVTLAALTLPLAMVLMKLIDTVERCYPLRLWLVRRGYIGYSAPDPSAILMCRDCDYRGVFRVDKHRPAPMSDVNWGLYCPGCGIEREGPMHSDAVAEYVNRCRATDVLGYLLKAGGYGAFKTVVSHNRQYALPVGKIRELQSASEATQEE